MQNKPPSRQHTSSKKVQPKLIFLLQVLQYEKWQVVEPAKSLENHIFSKIALKSLALLFLPHKKIHTTGKVLSSGGSLHP